jgi:periplasmic protein TonB
MSTAVIHTARWSPLDTSRLVGTIAVACAHLFVAIWLWTLGLLPDIARESPPLTVSLLSPPAERTAAILPALQPPPSRRGVPAAPLLAVPAVPTAPSATPLRLPQVPPQVTIDEPVPVPAAVPRMTGLTTAQTTEPHAPAPATEPVQALVQAVPPPSARPQLSMADVQYRVLPPVQVPRAARRAGESGTVWLRVVVDTEGRAAHVQLHRSSGFARLDEQALWAMRQALFRPHTRDGRPVEVEVIAPIEYPSG